MIVYKLFRERKDKSIGSLFINRKVRLPLNENLEAEYHPTKGFAVRPHWHCCSEPVAPHLSMKNRVWYTVEIPDNSVKMERPENQGGMWYLADRIKILSKVDFAQ